MAPDRARTLAARVLDDAMESTGVTNADLSRHLGCDEKVIRNLRAGVAPLTGTVILRLPSRLRAVVLRGLDLAADPTAPVAPEAAGCAVQCAAADVIAQIATAMRDGRITASELHDMIRPALARLDGAAAPLRARGDA
jgi:hypothetical protein